MFIKFKDKPYYHDVLLNVKCIVAVIAASGVYIIRTSHTEYEVDWETYDIIKNKLEELT